MLFLIPASWLRLTRGGNALCLPMSDTILHGISTVHQVIWVKACSTILWPLPWSVTSGIKGEQEGKSAIKSETLTVNFVLFLFSPPCTNTLTQTQTLWHTRAQTYTQSSLLARGHGPPQAKEWTRIHNFKSHYHSEISLLLYCDLLLLQYTWTETQPIKSPLSMKKKSWGDWG